MTISSSVAKSGPYNGNGATTSFSYGFKIIDESHVQVILTDSDGIETVQTIATDYTVTGVGVDGGGNVSMVVAPATGELLTLKLDVPLTQEVDLENQGAFFAETIESALDKVTQIVLQQQEVLDRCVQVDISSGDDPADFQDSIHASEAAAAASASSASTSASTATTQAGLASASASNAATSETNAATSASNASTSASNASTSASNAATAETNAETAETNAETAQAAAELAQASAEAAAAAIFWNFDTSTSMADPGTGDLRLNNATVASVTAIAVSALAAATGNPDVSDQIVTWDDSTNTNKGTITIRKAGTPATFAVFTVSGAVTDNTTWLQIAVTHVASNGALSAGDDLYLSFARAGDKGADGTGSGDMLASAYPTLVSLEGLSLAAGDILYATAADTLARLPKGTNGQALVLASGVPSWATPGGGGGPVLITTVDASAASTVSFTSGIDGTYRRYLIAISDLVFSGQETFRFALSTNGGSTYDVTVRYAVSNTSSSDQEVRTVSSTGSTSMVMSNADLQVGTGVCSFEFFLDYPSGTSHRKAMFWTGMVTNGSNNADVSFVCGAASAATNSAVNAIKFEGQFGATLTGQFKLFGVY